MQSIKTALVAGAITLASTMAFGQGASLSTNSGVNVGTSKPDATMNSNTGVKANAGDTDASVNAKTKTMKKNQATTGADVNAGTRPSSSIDGSVNGTVK